MAAGRKLPWDNPRFKNWIAVLQAEKAAAGALARALQPFELKLAQLDMLMNIYRHPGISQHELARKLLVGRSNITMLLPALEVRGLVTREGDARDKRVLRLTLTQGGETLLLQALEVYSALLDKAMEGTTPSQCDMVGEAMRRMTERLRASS